MATETTFIQFAEGSAPSTPASTKWRIYFKTDGVYVIDDAGVETGPLAASVAGANFVGVKAFNNTTQSISNSTTTALTFNSEDYDTDTLHSTVSNTSRITVDRNGAWRFTYMTGVYTGNNTTGIRAIWLRKNGTTAIEGSEFRLAAVSSQVALTATCDVELASSDYVEVMVFQSSGGALSFGDSGGGNEAHFSSFSAFFLGTI